MLKTQTTILSSDVNATPVGVTSGTDRRVAAMAVSKTLQSFSLEAV